MLKAIVIAVVFTVLGLLLGRTGIGSDTGQQLVQIGNSAKAAILDSAIDSQIMSAREILFIEYPELLPAIARGGAFGGDFSRLAAQSMFGRLPDAIEDVKSKTTIDKIAPRTWLIKMPIVNAVLFETDAGLILIDTGMAPAGPAIVEQIKKISDKPLHTVIYTHGHVDHAYGTWALLEAGYTPEIIAHQAINARFDRYLLLPGSLARYMNQPVALQPRQESQIVRPTRTFSDRLEIVVGGETFVLQHHKGETDDQLYVWEQERKVLAVADYYQGFLPNAGNGKRAQRYVKEWAVGLREMAELKAEFLALAHGDAIAGSSAIHKELSILAEALESIWNQTIVGLNKGIRKDLIVDSVALPDHLANQYSLREQYVTTKDISKMIIKRYTGWWDDIPSHWSPAPIASRSKLITELAGGTQALVDSTREVLVTDVVLASHMAEWAYFATPHNPLSQQLIIDVYRKRMLSPEVNTQEMLTYLDIMSQARAQQLESR